MFLCDGSMLEMLIPYRLLQAWQRPQWFLMYVFSRFRITCMVAVMLRRISDDKKVEQTFSHFSLFPDLDIDSTVTRIKEDGFATGFRLPKQSIQEICQHIEQIKPCNDHDGPRQHNTGRSVLASDRYRSACSRSRYPQQFARCPAIQEIVHDPKLLQIAHQYLGVAPIYMGTRLWWSYADAPPYDQKRAGQAFHYDIDDYRALRFFFYLTDVDSDSGPHVVVKGSHRQKRLRDRIDKTRFRTDAAIVSRYGSSSIISLQGNAGFGFAEEPSIYHKGTPPKSQNRLILLIRYAMNDFGNHN